MYIKSELVWGEILIKVDENGSLSGLWFMGQKYFPKVEDTIYTIDEIAKDKKYQGVKEVIDQLNLYMNGKLDTFNLPLNPVGTDFQKLVWDELNKIPMGETTSYGEIAKAVALKLGKDSMSAQAVGGAVGHNPISIIVPCHRVLGAKGQLTGYAGGVDKKIAILKHEGVNIKE